MKIEVSEYIVTSQEGEEVLLQGCFISKNGEWLWKVYQLGYVLDMDMKWTYEPSPSNRTEAHIYRTRFSYEKALDMIKAFFKE